MKFLVVLLLAVAVSGLTFPEWQRVHDKQYESTAEHNYRKMVFERNLKYIEAKNQALKNYQLEANKFADMTPEEFRNKYLTLEVPTDRPQVPRLYRRPRIPDSWDWREKGAVSPVKDQASCGSCWAFSAVGNMEGQWFLAGNAFTQFSEQQLVDCDHECMDYNGYYVCDGGCNGGLMPNAFTYAIKKGMESEDDYPYKGYDDNCHYDKDKVVGVFSESKMLPNDEDQLAQWLVDNGPFSVAVEADPWMWYSGGVFDDYCGEYLDHGVLVVGYGFDSSTSEKYWIIKNSWSSDWGEDGYIRMIFGRNECGIADFPCSIVV